MDDQGTPKEHRPTTFIISQECANNPKYMCKLHQILDGEKCVCGTCLNFDKTMEAFAEAGEMGTAIVNRVDLDRNPHPNWTPSSLFQ